MRLAVVSDVHGSLGALEAVIDDFNQTSPDVVVHGGDLVVNGARPDEVATVIRELGWLGVLGNTDEMLWKLDELPIQLERLPRSEVLLRVLYEHTAPAARQRLTEKNLAWLQTLPRELTQYGVTIVHASPHDLWRAPPPDADDTTLVETYESLSSATVVYGHIHRPFIRELTDRRIANAGSVGLTWDADPRASYLLIEDGITSIRRVEYDIEAEVTALFEANLPYAHWLAEMRRRGRYIPPERHLNEEPP
jgi:putative phosphoesterase